MHGASAKAYPSYICFCVHKWRSVYMSNYRESHHTLPSGPHVPSTDQTEGQLTGDLALSPCPPWSYRTTKPTLTIVI